MRIGTVPCAAQCVPDLALQPQADLLEGRALRDLCLQALGGQLSQGLTGLSNLRQDVLRTQVRQNRASVRDCVSTQIVGTANEVGFQLHDSRINIHSSMRHTARAFVWVHVHLCNM